MNTFIIVRTQSTRLPQKCLLPFGECQTVLNHVIRRCREFDLNPVVCTTVHPLDDILEDIANDECVPFFRGSINNVEARLKACAAKLRIKQFHALDCDDPFFCGDEIKRSMDGLGAFYKVGATIASQEQALGLMGTSYNLNGNDIGQLPESLITPRNWRLTLDYKEDYWLLATLARLHGYKTPRWIIDEQADSSLSLINDFRMKEWKDKQCQETLTANTMDKN